VSPGQRSDIHRFRSLTGTANDRRSPAQAERGTASSSRRRSSAPSWKLAAATFSASWASRRVPGIGTTSRPWASSQASASWPRGHPEIVSDPPQRRDLAQVAVQVGALEARVAPPEVAARDADALLVDAAAAEGFAPRIPFETHSPASIRELVSAGLGVALLAESAAHAPGPAVRVYPLQPPVAHQPIGVIQVRGRPASAAARAWQRHLRQIYPGAG
jgi:DNA-binding transcriptional LysR family regulator